MREEKTVSDQEVRPGRLQSLKSIGFRVEPWQWIFVLCGSVLQLVNRERL